MKTQIGMKPENSVQVADTLNKLLSDEHVLYIKTRNAHWNVEGPDFASVHKFFEAQYNELEGIIDQVAERIRAIGHWNRCTNASALGHSSYWRVNSCIAFVVDCFAKHVESIDEK